MSEALTDQCRALAGVCQAAALTQAFARKGKGDENAFVGSLTSILDLNPDSTAAVFGGDTGLRLGLNVLSRQLSDKPDGKDAELTKYVASLLSLERKLSRTPKVMAELGKRLEQLNRQQSLYALLDEPFVSNIASVYSDLISPIGPRIQVGGSPTLLQQPQIQNRIRASLLAGIRAAVLWRQLGGKRRQILFQRRKLCAAAEQVMAHLPTTFE